MFKHLVSINDLSKETIEKIFKLADHYRLQLEKKTSINKCKDKIMATLFYEPSTRTRMSFESAMFRLGGKVISSADTKVTSAAAKGESLVDTIKVIQSYADIIVLRHFKDGAAMLAAENSDVPIINGGDGAHEHPTQTLCDLYTIKKLKKRKIEGMYVALCGDLRYGRTVHSLAYGLAKFGARIFTIAPEGFELPEYVEHRIKSEYGIEIKKYKKIDEQLSQADVFYMTQKTELELLPRLSIEFFDAVYVTRIQMERIKGVKTIFKHTIPYLINKELLNKAKGDTIVMHPLPRRNELSYDIDQDKRAAYFKQAAYGIPIRMALIALLLGTTKSKIKIDQKQPELFSLGKKCSNENCITNAEENVQRRYTKANGLLNTYRCFYCDQEQEIESNEIN